MKIDLHLTPEALACTAATLQAVYNSKAITRRDRSTLSICFDVAKVFDKKIINNKQTLFTAKKLAKISLKHHEADMLEILLIQQMATIADPVIRRIIQGVIDKLNQKLA